MNESEPSLLSLALANPILASLPQPVVAALVDKAEKRAVAAGDVLVHQGDLSDCAYLILDGDFDICVATAYGEVSLATVARGALIGEIGVFAELPRTATVRAKTAGHVLRFIRDELHRAGSDQPALLRMVIGRLGGQIGTFNRAMGLYTNAVSALERDDFDLGILDALRKPIPELMAFTESFCRMAEQIVHRRTHLAEMASASAIQRAMLPESIPIALLENRYEIEPHMTPARHVGGDLYDVFPLDKDHIVVTVGDVCGKGVPAALFMAVTQTTLRLAVRREADLGDEISAANALLAASNREFMFVTLFCAVLEISSGRVTYCNCGHNPPLLLRHDTDHFEQLTACGPPLGIDGDLPYKARSFVLAPGDRLFLYTDGVTEAEDMQSAQYGMERLEPTLLAARSQSTQACVDRVVQSVTEFAQGAPQSDDITCLGLTRLAP